MFEGIIRPRLFGALGAAVMALAVVWWFIVFGQVVRNGYGTYAQASQCIWGQDYLCTLLLSLCTLDHPLIPKVYRPELFWSGAALVIAAFAAAARRRTV